jgi:hypothetical protein
LSCGLTCTELSSTQKSSLISPAIVMGWRDRIRLYFLLFLGCCSPPVLLQPICRGGCQGQWTTEQTSNTPQTKDVQFVPRVISFCGGDSSCDGSECSLTARGSESREKLYQTVPKSLKRPVHRVWCGANDQAKKTTCRCEK